MEKGKVIIIYGNGKGKTSSAIGKGIKNLGAGKSVNMIQFLKGSCDMLILDEILGLVDRGIMSQDELVEFIRVKPDEMDLIITGRVLCEGVRTLADEIYRIDEE